MYDSSDPIDHAIQIHLRALRARAHSHAIRTEVLLARSATSLPMTSALAFQQRWHLFPCLLHGNETDISFNLNDKQITHYRVHIDVFEAQIEIILHLAEESNAQVVSLYSGASTL